MTQPNELERLRAEVERLRRVIRIMAASPDDLEKEEEEMPVDAPDAAGSEGDSDSEASDEAIAAAMWDEHDRVYRCTKCCGEIDEGVCSWCLKEHIVDEEDEYDSLPTSDNQAFSEDRVLPPRGTTPLLDVPKEGIPVPFTIVNGPPDPNNGNRPKDRSNEYLQLIRRGATRAMCEEFSLEFTSEKGIVAWMNQDLMDEFSGPAMQHGDNWKIYLGRRVKLDEGDLDGTLFIEAILEDGILCHPKSWDPVPRWVTVKERAGIWATLPNPDLENPLELNYDWHADEHGRHHFCLVDPVTGARGETPDDQGQEDSDSDSDEEPNPQALQNLYNSDDSGEEGEEGGVKVEEEEGGLSLSVPDPTIELGIAMQDGDDEDMEWEEQSTDPSSCDSDFYDSE